MFIFLGVLLGSVHKKNLLGMGLVRNYILSKQFGGPLLAALNIFRDPLLVSPKFETPLTYLSVLTLSRVDIIYIFLKGFFHGKKVTAYICSE